MTKASSLCLNIAPVSALMILFAAGSGALTLGVPNSPGVPADFAKYTLTSEFNNLPQLEQLFTEHGHDIACIIVEPVAGNMNCIPPAPGFLEGLRQLCDQYGSVLIFDEVMTGFRVALGGAQAVYNVKPDLTTLGKIIGGGMPVGAYAGSKEIMSHIAPLGPVYQAGTLSGNPVAMAAGLAQLTLCSSPGFYEDLEQRTQDFVGKINRHADAKGYTFNMFSIGSIFWIAPKIRNFWTIFFNR